MSYDPKCYQLASVFLEDHPGINTEERRAELAQFIQTEIEEQIEYYLVQFVDHVLATEPRPKKKSGQLI